MFLVFYFVGQMVHAVLQIDSIARSGKSGYTRLQILAIVYPRLIARIFVPTMLFTMVWGNTDLIVKIAGLMGYTVGSSIAFILAIVMGTGLPGWSFAGLMGYMSDSLLSFIPWVKGQLPTIDPQMYLANAAAVDAKGGTT